MLGVQMREGLLTSPAGATPWNPGRSALPEPLLSVPGVAALASRAPGPTALMLGMVGALIGVVAWESATWASLFGQVRQRWPLLPPYSPHRAY
jgi:hypothetical protein